MDALTLLRKDHDTIKPLLTKIKETTDRAEKGRSVLFSRIKAELSVHEIIEEEMHHIEEEEGEMFSRARQVFDADELEALGERMARRKETAREELFGPSRSGSR